MSGCAALVNSGRSSYDGPTVKPIWTVQGFAFDGSVLIHDGLVYVRARPLEKDEKRLGLYARHGGKVVDALTSLSGSGPEQRFNALRLRRTKPTRCANGLPTGSVSPKLPVSCGLDKLQLDVCAG
jgi:hypothetical protein